MNLTGTIESAERQFKQILEEFFVSVYNEKSLPSHGIYHHRRVWNYARELLLINPKAKGQYTSEFTSKLIIACYLHDIGMSVDAGIRHGVHSRELCQKFLSYNNLSTGLYSDLLETIENHDKKDYIGGAVTNDLLTILSVADDLDAFGFIGIYRYSEIYLKRNIKPEILGEMILENASKRFGHFMKIFNKENELVMKHIEKYNVLFSFFTGYNKQVRTYQFYKKNPSGYCGVIELFIKMIDEKSDITGLITSKDKYRNDEIISWFLDGLKTEI